MSCRHSISEPHLTHEEKEAQKDKKNPIMLWLKSLALFTVPEKEKLYLTLNTFEQKKKKKNPIRITRGNSVSTSIWKLGLMAPGCSDVDMIWRYF